MILSEEIKNILINSDVSKDYGALNSLFISDESLKSVLLQIIDMPEWDLQTKYFVLFELSWMIFATVPTAPSKLDKILFQPTPWMNSYKDFFFNFSKLLTNNVALILWQDFARAKIDLLRILLEQNTLEAHEQNPEYLKLMERGWALSTELHRAGVLNDEYS